MYLEVQNMSDRKWAIAVTKNPVGVNGIDPARQGIDPSPYFAKASAHSIISPRLKIDRGLYRLVVYAGQNRSAESLANRANAIRPYDILRFRSHLKQTQI